MMHFDVAIVGAGLAGSALAVALTHARFQQQTGRALRVALIEARELPKAMPPVEGGLESFDLRNSALTVGTLRWLEKLDVWSEIKAQRSCPFHQMEVWVEEGTGSIGFDAAEVGADSLGEVVENRLLVATLVRRARASAQIDIISGATVERIDSQQGSLPGHVLTLSNEEQLSAELVIAADGAQSALRQLMDVPVRQWDYGHDAIACNVEMEKPHGGVARQRFGRHGPVAFLPLGDADGQLCTIVWSQDRERAAELMELDDDAFSLALAESIEQRLGAVQLLSKRASFPLRQMHARHYVQPGFVLVADAAHTVHPLAGQGINLGLADVAELVDTLAESLDKNRALGDMQMLKRFQRRRKTDNLAMMAIIEGFKRIYQPLPLPAMLLRNSGMKLIDQHHLLKGQIIRYAMGVQPS